MKTSRKTSHVVAALRIAAVTSACLAPAACDSPAPRGVAGVAERTQHGVVRLEGSPEEIGTRHGTFLRDAIRIMLDEYVGGDLADGERGERLLGRVRAMRQALPEWYLQELRACARAAGVHEDTLLYAQCEGDIKGLGGCTSYAAFGPATRDGRMEIGRNFDYWGIDATEECAVVLAVVPRREDGHAFVSVGWAGILGGWTFLNEKGLFVANNVAGYGETDPRGVPTLILERIIAQKAATLDEAIAIIRETPRMRRQALVIAQTGDAAAGIAPDAAVVRYDAATVAVKRATNGVAFHSSRGANRERLLEILGEPGHEPADAVRSAGSYITLHSVVMRPSEHALWVAHGRRSSAHLGEYVRYDVRSLLGR